MEVQHMVLVMGRMYVAVDIPAATSAEAVDLVAPFLRREAYMADLASDKTMVRLRVLDDALAEVRRELAELEKLRLEIQEDGQAIQT